MVYEIGGKWLYSCCFMGCCLQNLFKIDHCILVLFLSSFFSMRFLNVHMVHPCNSINTTTVQEKSDLFHRIDQTSIWSTATHAFARRILTSLSEDETLLLRYVNLSIYFRCSLFTVEMAPSRLTYMKSMQQGFDLGSVFARSAVLSAYNVSVIVSAKYCLLLVFFSVKPFFIRPIYVRST